MTVIYDKEIVVVRNVILLLVIWEKFDCGSVDC